MFSTVVIIVEYSNILRMISNNNKGVDKEVAEDYQFGPVAGTL